MGGSPLSQSAGHIGLANPSLLSVENRFADDFADRRVREDEFLDRFEPHLAFDRMPAARMISDA